MKPKLLLRIASVLILFHAIGHSFGHATWKQSADLTKQEVIKQMTENKFPFMGTVRSMTEYYDGFGYIITVVLLMIASLLWFASNATAQNAELARKFIISLSVSLLATGILELIYFFPFAASLSLIASVLGFYSIILLNKQKNA